VCCSDAITSWKGQKVKSHRGRCHEGQGVRTPQRLGCGVLYGSNPREINVIYKQNRHQGRLYKRIKRSKSPARRCFASDPTAWGAYSARPAPYLVGREENFPSEERHPFGPFQLHSYAISVNPDNVADGLAPICRPDVIHV